MNLSTNFWGGAAAPYQIEQSLRFADGGNYLTRTPSSAGSRTTWTYSAWVKYTIKSANHGVLLSAGAAGSSYDNIRITTTGHTPNNALSWYANNANYSRTSAKIRDPSAWYHFVFVWDTTNGTAADRRRMYINGQRVSDFYDNSNPGSSAQSYVNNNWLHAIGALTYNVSTTSEAMDGYMAEVHFIDGTAKDPTDFGEYDDNNVWRPIAYSGSYGTNGYYLKFDPSATNGIGHDHSGNGNNWSASGFVTSGTGTDVMSDTPTNNFCTWNPVAKGPGGTYPYQVLSNGNLQHQYKRSGMGDWFAEASFALAGTENYYWEVKVVAASSLFCLIGICEQDWTWNSSPTVRYQSNNGKISNHVSDPSNNATYTGATYGNGDVIGCAWNGTNKTLQFYKNGTAQGSPLSPTVTTGKTFVPCWHAASDNWEVVLNCGQRAFEYTPPTGYKTLSTNNLPAPDIADGSAYFNTVLYTGNGSNSHAITGVGFQPDLVWGKCRNVTTDHYWVDSVRGVTKVLRSNVYNPEYTQSDSLVSFDSDGFTLDDDNSGGPSGNFNISGRTYAAWNWKAGGSGSSNTDGSITSTVSANTTAGFSIVGYSGGSTGSTVGHGLGVAPKMIIVKNRSSSSNWMVWQDGFSSSQGMNLDNPDAKFTSGSNTFIYDVTSTTFKIGTSSIVNAGSNNFVAYCFAEVEGYSKFGTYTGNGNSNGPFVWCGFRPAWVMYKRTGGSDNWFFYDTTRDDVNVSYKALRADQVTVEKTSSTDIPIDILSNGFKIKFSGTAGNGSGESILFMAFAEHPFGGEGVSPACAR